MPPASISLDPTAGQTEQEAQAVLLQLAGSFFGGLAGAVENGTLEAATLLEKPQKILSSDEQVRLVEARYRTLVEQIPVVTFMAELNQEQESNEIYVSPQIESMLGYSQKEWIENPVLWYERLHPDDKDRWNDEFARTVTLDETFRSIYRFIARDGHVVWVRGEAKIVRDQQGLPQFIQGVGFDVTELKRAEEANALLAAIVGSSGDAIVGKSRDGLIVSWNPGAERMYGYSPHQILGQSVTVLIPPDHPDEMQQILRAIERGERWVEDDTVHLDSDGHRIAVSLVVSPIRDDNGKPLGSSMIARDISERKEAERQIKASLQEKETLLKEIHHRVKNNLQITCSLFSLQAAAIQDPTVVDIFRQSENRIQSMALVHEKLYQSSSLSEIDVAEYIQSLVPNLLQSYGTQACNVQLHVKVENAPLEIDKAIPLGLMITELISNCIKHAFKPGAPGDIWIELHREGMDHLLLVADNGAGLPATFDMDANETLGMQLIGTLTNQLGGSITHRGSGRTEFLLKFPGQGGEN